ncbi:MAG: NADH-quinone oxidoreductase subunit N [Deltaproteobacteria bacterium]|nr:NADH-quinone oxidoreductase subunit N [Deltaproteobacteria bacterium]
MFLGNLASVSYFLPEFILTATILILIITRVATKDPQSTAFPILSLVGVGLAILFAAVIPAGEGKATFEGMVAYDAFAVFFKMVTALAAIVVIFMSMDSREMEGGPQVEFYIFLLSSLIGMFLLSSSTDIVMLYLAFELVSIPSYLLAGYLKGKVQATEAAMKYVVYGGTASGVMIYGFSILFGLTGSTQIGEIGRAVAAGAAGGMPIIPLVLAAVMITVGFGYKIAAVPFHMWCPDVYEGAATPATAYFSVAPKAAGFAVAVRFFYSVFAAYDPATSFWHLTTEVNWTLLFAVMSAITMTVGNLVAVKQDNVKRLLAYSSISHAGYMLMGLVLLTPAGIQAILFYLMVYLFMNLGAFYVVLIVGNETKGEDISDFAGLGSRSPFMAVSMAAFLFALAGIPPFSGFFGKLYLFAETIDRQVYWLVVVAALNSVVALYYYARIVKAMFFDEPKSSTEICVAAVPRAMLVILVAPTVLLVLNWEPVARIAANSVKMLVF